MKSLAVRVLGDFGVDGVEPQALGSKKARQALRLLALGGGQVVPSDVLIDEIWPGAVPSRPEDQLAVLMSRLRSVLGRDRIEHRGVGYVLHFDWLDSAELALLADEVERRGAAGNVMGAAAAARVALSLVRGAGEPAPATGATGDWAAQRLGQIERLTARAWAVAGQALLAAGDWMAAADAAAAALAHIRTTRRRCACCCGHGWPGARSRRRSPRTRTPASAWPMISAPILRRRRRPCTWPSCAASLRCSSRSRPWSHRAA